MCSTHIVYIVQCAFVLPQCLDFCTIGISASVCLVHKQSIRTCNKLLVAFRARLKRVYTTHKVQRIVHTYTKTNTC